MSSSNSNSVTQSEVIKPLTDELRTRVEKMMKEKNLTFEEAYQVIFKEDQELDDDLEWWQK